MTYKRYFYRKGKKFGPYYYESYRDIDGKIKNRYFGTTDPDIKSDKGRSTNKKIEEIPRANLDHINSGRKNLFLLILLLIILIIMDSLFFFFIL